jgi:hypothetical protein
MVAARQLFVCTIIILVLGLGGCAATEQTVSTDSDSTLEKPEHQFHGEVNALYGHSVGN